MHRIVKTITWRIIATLTTFTLALAFTGSMSIATSIGISEVIIKIIFYYLHEVAWDGFIGSQGSQEQERAL